MVKTKLVGATWTFDQLNGISTCIHVASRNKRVLAVVHPSGSWQTFDADGAGGESGKELSVFRAKEEAENSILELGYL